MCSKLNNRGSSLGYDVRTPSVMLTLSLDFAIKKLMQECGACRLLACIRQCRGGARRHGIAQRQRSTAGLERQACNTHQHAVVTHMVSSRGAGGVCARDAHSEQYRCAVGTVSGSSILGRRDGHRTPECSWTSKHERGTHEMVMELQRGCSACSKWTQPGAVDGASEHGFQRPATGRLHFINQNHPSQSKTMPRHQQNHSKLYKRLKLSGLKSLGTEFCWF